MQLITLLGNKVKLKAFSPLRIFDSVGKISFVIPAYLIPGYAYLNACEFMEIKLVFLSFIANN